MRYRNIPKLDMIPFEKYREFSPDQKESLRFQVKRIKLADTTIQIDYGAVCYTLTSAEQKRDFFFKRLEFICSEQSKVMHNDKKQDLYAIYTDYSKSLNGALKTLIKICNGDLPVMFDSRFFHNLHDNELSAMHFVCASNDFYGECVEESCQALNHLSRLVKLIEDKKESLKKNNRGPEKAGNDNLTNTIKYIASAYEDILGVKPTMYKDGPFFNIIKVMYDYFGIPCVDPSKRIRKAIAPSIDD